VRRLFIGIGNAFRGDDAAGLLAARSARERLDDEVEVLEMEGEPVDLIEAWRGAEHVLVATGLGGAFGRGDNGEGLSLAAGGLATYFMGKRTARMKPAEILRQL